MTSETNIHRRKFSLRKAFELKMKATQKMSEANYIFNVAIGDSKYQDIEIPDDLVDSTEYEGVGLTFEEFVDRMDEVLEESKEHD